MSEEQPAVVVKDLYKSFKLPHEQHSGIKQLIVNATKRKKGYEVQHVLNDISFEIKRGEFFGIVGRNGSGKSTLLKLLAGIYTPDKGHVQVNGSLTPFIELGVGFNPELTGRENVFMNGALLGFSNKEMEAMYGDIVEFAELERFMDQKLKNYSSGMQVRLAFSIAIRAKSDVLLIDEVLAVGDSAFQLKCFEYFEQLREEKRTVILVSHDMSNIKRFCTSGLLIDKGVVIEAGDIEEITSHYSLLNRPKKQKVIKADETETSDYIINRVHSKVLPNDILEIAPEYTVKIQNENNLPVVMGVSILNESGQYICGMNNMNSYQNSKHLGSNKFTDICTVDISDLFPGTYLVNLSLYKVKGERFELLEHKNYVSSFQIRGKRKHEQDGAFKISMKWISNKG